VNQPGRSGARSCTTSRSFSVRSAKQHHTEIRRAEWLGREHRTGVLGGEQSELAKADKQGLEHRLRALAVQQQRVGERTVYRIGQMAAEGDLRGWVTRPASLLRSAINLVAAEAILPISTGGSPHPSAQRRAS
jgi:hypothetical protein